MKRLLVDAGIPRARDAFSGFGAVAEYDAREAALTPGVFLDAELLVLRSVTRVDAAFLSAAPRLEAIASPTIGIDHIDAHALDAYRRRHGRPVPVFHAPGATAGGVADFALAGLLSVAASSGRATGTWRVGIWGFGNCGTALAKRLDRCGIAHVEYDPPLEERSAGRFRTASIEALLACDAVSLHVPLTTGDDSRWPTTGRVDEAILAALGGTPSRPKLLLNTARGAVVREKALSDALASGRLTAVIDVWENEPEPDPALVKACRLATPHAAGSVLEGRLRAVAIIRDSLARFVGATLPSWVPESPDGPAFRIPGAIDAERRSAIVAAVGIESLSNRFREAYLGADPDGRGAAFDRVRRSGDRRELDWT